jgi:hypothetical protein
LAVVAAVFVALELTGIADFDAPLARSMHLEIFQLGLAICGCIVLIYGYARTSLWLAAPTKGREGPDAGRSIAAKNEVRAAQPDSRVKVWLPKR